MYFAYKNKNNYSNIIILTQHPYLAPTRYLDDSAQAELCPPGSAKDTVSTPDSGIHSPIDLHQDCYK